MKRITYAASVAAVLGASCLVAFPAAAAPPDPRGPHDCQGYDVAKYQKTSTDPSNGLQFGQDVVSGFAQDGQLVGFVRGAANCGNN